MLAPSVVEEIRRLLAEDTLSYRKIARLTGVSRGTIGAIASGKRPDYQQTPPCPRRSIRWSLPGRRNVARAAAAWSIIPAASAAREPGGAVAQPAAAPRALSRPANSSPCN